MKLYRVNILVVIVCLLSYFAGAQDGVKPSVKVSGEVKKPFILSIDDISTMQRTNATIKDRDGKEHTYTGVAIQQILDVAGVTTGKQLRAENLSKYVMIKCADGYEVLFSLAELDSSFNDRTVILAYESEGKALPAGKGPFRLVVPGEKKPARSSHQVVEIVIRFAKE